MYSVFIVGAREEEEDETLIITLTTIIKIVIGYQSLI